MQDFDSTKPLTFNKYSQSFKQGTSYLMKVERLKQLPTLKMKSMDLQKHLQEYREKMRR
jgi:hypothetical protein